MPYPLRRHGGINPMSGRRKISTKTVRDALRSPHTPAPLKRGLRNGREL